MKSGKTFENDDVVCKHVLKKAGGNMLVLF